MSHTRGLGDSVDNKVSFEGCEKLCYAAQALRSKIACR